MLTTSVGEGWCVKGIFSNIQLFNHLAVGVVHPVTAGEDMQPDLVFVAALETWRKEETHAGGVGGERMCCSAALNLKNTKRRCKG